MKAIDVHAHVVVQELVGEGPWRARLVREGGGHVVEWRGRHVTSAVREFVEPARIVEQMEQVGVDGVVLSPWVSMLPCEEPDLGVAREVCEAWNEGLSRICQRFPGRVWAFGAVPLQDPQAAAQLLAELGAYPGLVGVEIPTRVQGRLLGDDALLPFWEAVEDLGLAVFVHPTASGLGIPALAEHYLWNSVGNPVETAMAAAHLVVRGVVERYPRLRVLLAHGGGALPALRGRLRHAHRVQPQARSNLRNDVEGSLRRLYYDTVTHDPVLLRQLVEWVGPGQVLLGSDFPFDMGVEQPVAFVRSAGLVAPAEAQVLRDNAVRVLGLG